MRILMKLLALVALFSLLSGCDESQQSVSASATGRGAVIGAAAPDFTLTDINGNRVSLSQFRGKVVLVNFWATWCPPCREEMPSMERLYRHYSEQGMVLLAINIEENGEQAVSQFLQGNDYTFPILLDTRAEVQNAYQVFRFPETFVVDQNGVIIDHVVGARNWMSGTLVKRINFLLNG